MGRVKLKIKRLENMSARHVTYSKRRAGITKKATELSILCDIDILFLMFSPTGKPTLCLGEHCTIEDVITKFAQLTPQERLKRKLECLEALRKTFKKLDHDVNISDFMKSSSQTVEELTDHLQNLKSQVSDMQKKLSYWTNPDNANNLEQIMQMEEALRKSLDQIKMRKMYLGRQLLPLDFTSEFHNVMQFPMNMTNEQQPSNVQWLHDVDDQNFMFLGVPSLPLQRNYFFPGETSLENYHSYFNTENQAVCNKPRQEESLNNPVHNSCLQLQLGAQHPCHSYGVNCLGENKFQQVSLQEDHLDFQVNSFEPPRPGYEVELPTWVSTTGACGVPLFNENTYPQLPKQT